MLVALVAAAINLRIAIAIVGPLIEDIRADTGMSSAVAGALTTIPFLCMGAFSFAGPELIRRYGAARVLLSSLGLIAAGTLVRAAMPSPALLLVATVPIGLGIALAGVAIPTLIKRYFSARAGPVTGAYTTAMAIGITAAGFAILPIAAALGGWREAMAVSALPALLALPLWLGGGIGAGPDPGGAAGGARRRGGGIGAAGRHPVTVTRTGWLLGLAFGLQSLCFAAMVSWGPAIYEDAGWSADDAAFAVSSLGLLAIVASLTMPWLSDAGDRRTWLAAMVVVMGAGVLGVAIEPGSLGGLWMLLFGFGSGAVPPLSFALPLDLESDPIRVSVLTAAMLGVGHLLAALGPVLVGALRDLSGGFTLPLGTLFALTLVNAVIALLIPKTNG